MSQVTINQLTNGTTADATQVDANFNALAAAVNGGIDATNITAGSVTPSLLDSTYLSGWVAGQPAPTVVVANGNRSYNLTYSASIKTYQSNGMRRRFTRTVAAPTQCTSLNGTTQYYTKTSPAGIAFTDTPTIMAWVKLTAYGTTNVIVSRKATGTAAGWELLINTTGQVQIRAGNTAANLDDLTSVQSIPLNKWVHVAASLTMSTSGSSAIYIDGVSAPGTFTNGTSTTITQSGTLSVGANNDGTNFFTGKIAQVAVFSAIINSATILSYMSQGLAGTETSLVSAYSFNNSVNDLNANANNLTANGSAVATSADSPFGNSGVSSSLEYGVTTAISADGLTETVQVPEGCAIPTSGGVSAVSYSTQAYPYGLPRGSKWTVYLIYDKAAERVIATPTSGVWANFTGLSGTLPVGAWNLNRKVLGKYSKTSTTVQLFSTISTGAATESDDRLTTYYDAVHSANFTQTVIPMNLYSPDAFDVSVATTIYLNIRTDQAAVTSISVGTGTPNNASTLVVATPAYF